jgi:hypothetical protein
MKPRRAVHAIGIEQRQRRVAERRRALDECFGQRGALKKAEGRSGMKLDVHGSRQRRPGPVLWTRRVYTARPALLVNNPLEEPLVGVALAEQPIRRPLSKRDVPFVAIPGGRDSGLGTRETGLRPAFPPGAR